MSTKEVITQLEELPEEAKQTASEFIAFLYARTKAKQGLAMNDTNKSNESLPKSGFGCMKGKIWMSPDFDEPLEDFKDYM